MKVKYSVYVLLLFVCAFFISDSVFRSVAEVSVYQTTPCVRLGTWEVGQSSGSGNTVTMSFITNSEETCCVTVSVKYCSNQSDGYVYPITDFDFEISMNNGFKVVKQTESTSGPDPSKLSESTLFTVEAKLEGPKDTETYKESCDGINGRNNQPMHLTVTFKGKYGSDANNQRTVTLTKKWEQDTIDLIRQEYVDMTPSGNRAELPVPSKSSFVPTISGNGTDGWNTGHYGYMVDEGLISKKASWLAKVNELYRTGKKSTTSGKKLSEFTDRAFSVTSAYRNPYHQRFYVQSSFHGRHPFGDALDVGTLDVDGDNVGVDVDGNGTIDKFYEQVRHNEAKSDDGKAMQRAAEAAGAKWTASYEHYNTHTHADWTLRSKDGGSWPPVAGTVYSPPCDISNHTTSTDTPSPTPAPTTPAPTTPASILYACGIHSGPETYKENHVKKTPQCGDDTHKDYICKTGHDHWDKQSKCYVKDTHGQSCSVTDFYFCQYHTHQYPDLIAGACGHSYTASSSYSHRSETCPKNSNGDSCTTGSYYVCKSHTHQYPPPKRTCWRADCGVEVTNAADHKAACGSGNHSYWPGCPDLSVRWWHQRTTHAEITCKRCGVKFRPCSNTKTCKNGWGHKK